MKTLGCTAVATRLLGAVGAIDPGVVAEATFEYGPVLPEASWARTR